MDPFHVACLLGGIIILATYVWGADEWYTKGKSIYTTPVLEPILKINRTLYISWVTIVAAAIILLNTTVYSEIKANDKNGLFEIKISTLWYVFTAIFGIGAMTWAPFLKFYQNRNNDLPLRISLWATFIGSIFWWAIIYLYIDIYWALAFVNGGITLGLFVYVLENGISDKTVLWYMLGHVAIGMLVGGFYSDWSIFFKIVLAQINLAHHFFFDAVYWYNEYVPVE